LYKKVIKRNNTSGVMNLWFDVYDDFGDIEKSLCARKVKRGREKENIH
jgi:hypothetical protein